MKARICIAAAFFLLVGCDQQPKIDASTDVSMKESIQKIRESLPTDKQDEFDSALKAMTLSQINLKDLMADNADQVLGEKLRKALDGKTSEQVIAEGQKTREAFQQRLSGTE